MLFDRCLLAKNKAGWSGIAEVRKRLGERWRFFAWVMLIIACIELFRLALAGFWYFSGLEYVILGLSIFFFIAFYKRSSKTFKYREEVILIPKPDPIVDEVGQVLGYRQVVALLENGEYRTYDITRFSHVVFGLIDYPWPERKNVSIDAFALYLAEKNGTPHAIVEGCFDKYSCFQLARRIAALTKLPLIELGKGQPFTKSISSEDSDARPNSESDSV